MSRKEVMAIGGDIYQAHENDQALVCVVQSPNSAANFFGNLHPCGRLCEMPFDLESARIEHSGFVSAMEDFGVKVVSVEAILAEECLRGAKFDLKKRMRLEDLAMEKLTYRLSPKCNSSTLSQEEEFYLSNEYKRQCIEQMNTSQLVQVIMTCPMVTLDRSHRDTSMIAVQHSMSPLDSLIFTRDQQITTRKGVVMANMASKVRDGEVDLMSEVMRTLPAPVIGRIQSPATMEGGDFFMAGDTCFIGSGLRTNSMAIQQLLNGDMLGCDYVVEVRDMFERSQDRMHLDCVFNIISHDLVLLMGSLESPTSLTRRLASEYSRDPITKRYVLTRSDVEFSTYLRQRGFHIQGIPDQFQLLYGVNCLNLGNSNLIMMHEGSARLIARNEHFKGRINVVEYGSVSAMYGSLHCTSQVVRRKNQDADPKSRLPYAFKDSMVCPALGKKPSAVLFVPEDVAFLFRNGIAPERLDGCDDLLIGLKGRSLVTLVLKEFSAWHLLLQALDIAHVHVLSREESFLKSPNTVSSTTPAAFAFVSDSKLTTFPTVVSTLQLDALTSTLSYALPTHIPCSVANLMGALDVVLFGHRAILSIEFKSSPLLMPWLEKMGLEPLFVQLLRGSNYSLSQLLYINSGFCMICKELIVPESVKLIHELLPESHNSIVVAADQVPSRLCFGFVELSTRGSKKLLIASNMALSMLNTEQDQILRSSGFDIVPVSLKTTEAMGVGSIRDFLIPL